MAPAHGAAAGRISDARTGRALRQQRAAMAEFVGADADDLVFVSNSTAGVNTVLRSLMFQPGDELLVTDFAYNACRNALDFVAEMYGCAGCCGEDSFSVSQCGRGHCTDFRARDAADTVRDG